MGTGATHGPAAWHHMPAPEAYYPAPAYFVLPYSYAYAPATLHPIMPHLHSVPLLSRIQLVHDTGRWVSPSGPDERSGRRGRQASRVEDAPTPTAGVGHANHHASGQASRRRSASPARSGGGARSLLARLSSPTRPTACLPLADRLSDGYADGRTRTTRRARPLASRLSSPARTESPPPSPPLARPRAAPAPPPAPLDRVPRTPYQWDAPDRDVNALRPQPNILRAVRDDRGHHCLTSLPIRSGEEVLRYLSLPFEQDDATPVPRLSFETARGPDPPSHPARLCAVPPGYVLLHEYWAPLRLALWKRYGPHCISRLTCRETEGVPEEARSPSEWSSALRPGQAARAVLGSDPSQWTDAVLSEIGLSPASEREGRDMVWENDTFLFRTDVENLASRLHKDIKAAPLRRRATTWARIRDSIRRIWGPDLTYFPDAREVAYLDSTDDLVRLRHWRALARLIQQWRLPPHLKERVDLATGGDVRALESDLQEVLQELGLREFGRETHPFTYRRIDA